METLVGLELVTLTPIEITLEFKRMDLFTLTLKMSDGTIRGLLHQGEKVQFVECATMVLHRLQVRLFHSGDHIALTNWGLSSKKHYLTLRLNQ